MSKKLIEKLSNLDLQRNCILREIDLYYYDKKKRQIHFEALKNVDSEIKKVKNLLKIEREIKNARNNDSNQASFKEE